MKFIVSQLGARRNYSNARVLFASGILDKLFIDSYYNVSKIPIFYLLDKLLPDYYIQQYRNYNPHIPPNYVDFDWSSAIIEKIRLRFQITENPKQAKIFVDSSKRLNKRIIEYAKQINTPMGFLGLDTSSLEFCEWASFKDWKIVIQQCVAPRSSQINLWKSFEEKYDLPSHQAIESCKILQERERKEWELSNKIIVPSSYVMNELIKDGVNANKISLVPFGFKSKVQQSVVLDSLSKKFSNLGNRPLKVLFVGNAGLRKGLIDLFNIAYRLKDENVVFTICGNIDFSFLRLLPSEVANNSKIIVSGHVNHNMVHEYYSKADLFLFPSYLEGSAMVTLEALSWGLPVITTHESGSLVEDQSSGFIHRAGDVDAFVFSLQRFLNNESLLISMSKNAIKNSIKYSLNNFEKTLLSALI